MKYTLTNISVLLVIMFFGAGAGLSQNDVSTSAAPTIQPTIMAIPFVPEGQSTRRGYDYSEITRIAITKIKEAFDDRGVNTIDFRAKLKQV
jgi:hypothetical protein